MSAGTAKLITQFSNDLAFNLSLSPEKTASDCFLWFQVASSVWTVADDMLRQQIVI